MTATYTFRSHPEPGEFVGMQEKPIVHSCPHLGSENICAHTQHVCLYMQKILLGGVVSRTGTMHDGKCGALNGKYVL